MSWNFWIDLLVVIPYILALFDVPYVRYTALIRVVRIKSMVGSVENILNISENV